MRTRARMLSIERLSVRLSAAFGVTVAAGYDRGVHEVRHTRASQDPRGATSLLRPRGAGRESTRCSA
jgi:hypothetical protein